MKICIYQIDLEKDKKRVAFVSFEQYKEIMKTESIQSEIYKLVFEGEVDCNSLKEVYQKFNLEHPENYRGHSLSVSDIVEVVESETVEPDFYYCDSIGFKPCDFSPDTMYAEQEKRKIKVLMVEPGKRAYETEVGTNLHELYDALNCDCIQTFYPYEDLVVIVCNA